MVILSFLLCTHPSSENLHDHLVSFAIPSKHHWCVHCWLDLPNNRPLQSVPFDSNLPLDWIEAEDEFTYLSIITCTSAKILGEFGDVQLGSISGFVRAYTI